MKQRYIIVYFFMPAMLLFSSVTFAQTISVSGYISSAENNEGIIGATVSVEGTSKGTVSDASGLYRIEDINATDTLVFSFIGFKTEKVFVNGRTTINVYLKPNVSQLNQLVVIGYGEQRASDLTGSVVSIKTDKTANLPDYNILQSIEGRVPGVHITSPYRPGQNPGLRIRGINSISASNSPLIVIDGIIYQGSLTDFNPNDFSSIDILKGPSAAAVYGSRAANGVLILTSKSGTTEKPKFNFRTYIGFQRPTYLIPVLDGPGYLQKVLDYREATGQEADPGNIDEYITPEEAENRQKGITRNWIDSVVRTGIISNYHLDVSGRSKNTNYYLSGTYFKNQGIVVNDDFDRIALNLNLTNHITDWYSITAMSKFSSQNRSGRPASLRLAFWSSPYGDYFDKDGPGGLALFPVGDPIGLHPLANTLIKNQEIRTTLWGLLSSNLNIPFIPGLKWTLNYSSNLRIGNQNEYFDNKSSSSGITANGIGTKDQTKVVDWTVDNILHYRRTFNRIHSLYVTLLYSLEGSRRKSSGLRGSDFFTQVLGYSNLGIAEIQNVSSNYEDQHSISYMGRINYSYKDKYAITLTARRDGFSGFAKENKYAMFPSAAIAWTATNENFLKNVSWLSYLKLRLAYGKNGNQGVGRYESLARMSSDKYVFGQQSITTIHVHSMANKELTWETTTAKNLGIDFGLLRNRITGSIDFYSSETKDLLLRRALPEITGFKSILTNIGEVHNEGIELSLNSSNLENKNWTWKTGFVFSFNRNRIDHLTGLDANNDGKEDDDIRDGWFIGESLYSIYGYKTNGIYQLKDKEENNIPPGFQPGDFRIVDTNNDGKISSEDRIILGNTLPNFSFSISNTFSYKNFNLYILIRSIQGGGKKNYYVGNNIAYYNVNQPFTTFTSRMNLQDVPYWTPDRPSEKFPRIDYIPSLPHPVLESRSFVRVQDVSLSYTFNEAILEKIRLHNLKLYLSAKNIYTWTKWSGYDPENATTLGDFPFMKTYTIGINFSF